MQALPLLLQAISHKEHLLKVCPRHWGFHVVGAGAAGLGLLHVSQQAHQLVPEVPPMFLDFVH